MFLPVADMDKNCLRQGDVLRSIPFPLLQDRELYVLGEIQDSQQALPYPAIVTIRHNHRGDPHYFAGQLKFRLSFCAVISNCCEIEPRNNKLLPAAFSVARLIPIKKSILDDPEKLASLRSNKDPRDPAKPGFLDYFHVTQHELLEGREWMVDFSQIASIPNSAYPDILTRKVLQMEDASRVKFKLKLAAYLARLSDEEVAAGLQNPWAI